jgi:hypothetical protein
MTPEEALAKLTELQASRDYEDSHITADEILCDLLKSLGHQEVVDAFNKLEKWYA